MVMSLCKDVKLHQLEMESYLQKKRKYIHFISMQKSMFSFLRPYSQAVA